MDSARATAASTAQALDAAARHHKREAAHHRRQARELRKQLDEFQRDCAARGIPLTIIDTAEEAQS